MRSTFIFCEYYKLSKKKSLSLTWVIIVQQIVFLPRLGEVGPVVDEVAGDVPVAGPVPQWRAEGLPEHILQVVSVVCSHPAGVGQHQTPHAVGLGEQVGVRPAASANSLVGRNRGEPRRMVTNATDEDTEDSRA